MYAYKFYYKKCNIFVEKKQTIDFAKRYLIDIAKKPRPYVQNILKNFFSDIYNKMIYLKDFLLDFYTHVLISTTKNG